MLGAATWLNPPPALADPDRCDGAQCVPSVVTITDFPPDSCTPEGNRNVFGVVPGTQHEYSFVCNSQGQWLMAPPLSGVRLPGDPCPAGTAAQSPDGLPMLCGDDGLFTAYVSVDN